MSHLIPLVFDHLIIIARKKKHFTWRFTINVDWLVSDLFRIKRSNEIKSDQKCNTWQTSIKWRIVVKTPIASARQSIHARGPINYFTNHADIRSLNLSLRKKTGLENSSDTDQSIRKEGTPLKNQGCDTICISTAAKWRLSVLWSYSPWQALSCVLVSYLIIRRQSGKSFFDKERQCWNSNEYLLMW
jgi:hypothetical protein